MRWVIGIYGALALTAVLYALVMGNYVRTNSEFSGLPLVLLGLPWSVAFGRYRPRISGSAFNDAVLVMSAYVALNMVILFSVGRVVSRFSRR